MARCRTWRRVLFITAALATAACGDNGGGSGGGSGGTSTTGGSDATGSTGGSETAGTTGGTTTTGGPFDAEAAVAGCVTAVSATCDLAVSCIAALGGVPIPQALQDKLNQCDTLLSAAGDAIQTGCTAVVDAAGEAAGGAIGLLGTLPAEELAACVEDLAATCSLPTVTGLLGDITGLLEDPANLSPAVLSELLGALLTRCGCGQCAEGTICESGVCVQDAGSKAVETCVAVIGATCGVAAGCADQLTLVPPPVKDQIAQCPTLLETAGPALELACKSAIENGGPSVAVVVELLQFVPTDKVLECVTALGAECSLSTLKDLALEITGLLKDLASGEGGGLGDVLNLLLGQCDVCVPACAGKQCGDDGCGGQCGACPDGQGCSDGQCGSCTASCDGKQCGDDGCGGDCGSCPQDTGCVDGQCVGCTPSCEGKQCGPDGCTGVCGACEQGLDCNAAGQCVGCAVLCDGKECGPDGCGGSCGTCTGGETCDLLGQCGGGCTADCGGKDCGPDGCGGICGTCAGGALCSGAGACVPPEELTCAGQCTVYDEEAACQCDEACFSAGDCCPSICGECAASFTDQCGGSGCVNDDGCEDGESCVGGVCVAVPPECENDGNCAPGKTCVQGACVDSTCTPVCAGLACGDDGCGGTCGDCPSSTLCVGGTQCLASLPVSGGDPDHFKSFVHIAVGCWKPVLPGLCGAVDASALTTAIAKFQTKDWYCESGEDMAQELNETQLGYAKDIFGCGAFDSADITWKVDAISPGSVGEVCLSYSSGVDPSDPLNVNLKELVVGPCAEADEP